MNKNAKIYLFLPIIAIFYVTSCNIGAPSYPDDAPFKSDTKEYTVMDFFYHISGKYTLTSMHNREPNGEPARQTNRIRDILGGKYPGMWSGDFLYQEADVNSRWTMIYECERQWKAGSIVQLMLHVVSPKAGVVDGKWNGLQHYNRWEYLPDSISVMSKLESNEWTDLLRNGGTLNSVWKERLDDYAQYFQYLKEKEVNVLFRPFHEMNQTSFWWNSGGPGNTAELFRLTRDYLVNEKGFDNIVWVWNLQDIDPISVSDWKRYDPGSGYWDIFTVDIYGGSFSALIYETALGAAGNKPIAIGECFKLPSPEELLKQPKWVFAMPWAGDTFTHNTDASLRTFYLAANTLTRDELPKFKYAGSASAPEINYVQNGNFNLYENEWPHLPLHWDTSCTGGDGESPVKTEFNRFVGYVNTNAYGFTLSQSITALPAGTYTLSAVFQLNDDSSAHDIKMNVYSGAALIKTRSVRDALFAAPRKTDHRLDLSGIETTGSDIKIEFEGINIKKTLMIDDVILN